MSLFGLYKNAWRPSRAVIEDALSGSLCRCTGYRPIVAAAHAMYDLDATQCAAGWRGPGIAADGSRTLAPEEEALTAQVAPIGDTMPALMALGTTVVLRHGEATRELPLEELYLAYQKTALQPGEFVAQIRIAQRAPGMLLRAYKISKRYDQDISAVFACFAL